MVNPPKEDDLLSHGDTLYKGLIAAATNGAWDDDEYRRVRKSLLLHPELSGLAPSFLKEQRDLETFRKFMQGKFGDYHARRTYIAEQLAPLLNQLEKVEVEGVSTLESYTQTGSLGRGGFGEVFRYRHNLLEMDFAFKVFSPMFYEGGEGHLERFFREARILFSLSHRSIVRVYDVGMLGRRPYIRMEYFSGMHLNERLRLGRLTPANALALVSEIASALKHAHEVGVVHRDIKPSNIMIAKPDLVRLIDFGLGVYIEQDIVSRITKSGDSMAGGHYTAPELLENPQLLEPTSDIYSLGAVWYTLLAGRPPAGSGAREALGQEVQLAEDYTDTLIRCIADKTVRYTSCDELIQDLKMLEN